MMSGLSPDHHHPSGLFRNRSKLRTRPSLTTFANGIFRRKSSANPAAATSTSASSSSVPVPPSTVDSASVDYIPNSQFTPFSSTTCPSTTTNSNINSNNPNTNNPSTASRISSSMFAFGGRRSSSSCARSSESASDALITLKHGIVNDDELARDGQRVSPARFNLVPFTEPPSPDGSTIGSDESVVDASSPATSSVPPSPGGEPRKSASFSQAGGHDGSFQLHGATLTKKVSEREATFYESAVNHGTWPVSLLPKYHGRVGNDTIRIENLTAGYSRPCVIDLKMGVQTVESDEKSLFKKLKMSTLDTITGSRSEGCRLEGLSMIRTLDKRTVNVKGSKRQTHGISADVRLSLTDVLTFFLTDESGVRTDVALRFQTSIEQLLRQFERNDKYLFIGSSILLIYDNDNQAPHMRWARALRKLHTIAPHVRLSEDQISGLTRRTLCDVRMIDFAHTGPLPPGQIRDDGYITGLRSVLRALKAIRVYRSKPIFSLRSAAIDMMEEERAKRLAQDANGLLPDEERGNFTFGTVLKELTAVSHTDEPSSL